MPVYAYACKDCGHAFDIRQSFSEDALTVCPECDGTRLTEGARSSKIDGISIADACRMQVTDLAAWVRDLKLPGAGPLLDHDPVLGRVGHRALLPHGAEAGAREPRGGALLAHPDHVWNVDLRLARRHDDRHGVAATVAALVLVEPVAAAGSRDEEEGKQGQGHQGSACRVVHRSHLLCPAAG